MTPLCRGLIADDPRSQMRIWTVGRGILGGTDWRHRAGEGEVE
jgi:hypothetical protein